MSLTMQAAVRQSGIPRGLVRDVMKELADLHREDAESVHPSVDYLCWALGGANRRAVQRALRRAREHGYVRTVCHPDCDGAQHGRGQSMHYEIDPDALPPRPSWHETRRAAGLPSRPEKGGPEYQKGGSEYQKGGLRPPDPDLDPDHPVSARAREGIMSSSHDSTRPSMPDELTGRELQILGGLGELARSFGLPGDVADAALARRLAASDLELDDLADVGGLARLAIDDPGERGRARRWKFSLATLANRADDRRNAPAAPAPSRIDPRGEPPPAPDLTGVEPPDLLREWFGLDLPMGGVE